MVYSNQGKCKLKALIFSQHNKTNNTVLTLLDHLGFNVIQSSKTNDTHKIVKSSCCDIIFLDHNNANDICKNLKSNTSTQHIPIFILSSTKNFMKKVHAFIVGSDEYLIKPLNIQKLSQAISNYFSLKSYKSDSNMKQKPGIVKLNHQTQLKDQNHL